MSAAAPQAKQTTGAFLKRLPPSDLAAFGLFAATLVAAIWCMTREIDKPLLGPHSFRQTQTAISAYYMAQDPSMFADYITPVLGKPWQIPMELPLYQYIVARVQNATGLDLDVCGKLVSVGAWLLCLVPASMLLRDLGVSQGTCWMTLSMALATPLYLFWSPAFLMETLGLLFALCMVAFALRGIRFRSWAWLVGSLVCGIVASMTKATTWAVSTGAGILLILSFTGFPRSGRSVAWILAAGAALALPFLPAKLWLAYGDSIKKQNPFARELIIAKSENQARWNFGTLDQKLSPETWAGIMDHVTSQLTGPLVSIRAPLLIFALVFGALYGRKRYLPSAACLAAFAAGPIIFTNLYREHSYYWCANGLWLVLSVGLALNALRQSPSLAPRRAAISWACVAGCTTIVIAGLANWGRVFLPIQKSLPSREVVTAQWTGPITSAIPPSRTLLIIGNDWNPNALYYSQRKGIAFPTAQWIPYPGPQLKESLDNLSENDRLGAVVVNQALLTNHTLAFFQSHLTELGMEGEPLKTPFGLCFLAKDLK